MHPLSNAAPQQTSGGGGGGVYHGNLTNCVVRGNSAGWAGGGVYAAVLVNCTVVGNTAGSLGGGIGENGRLYNSIVYYNSAPLRPDVDADYAYYSCFPGPFFGLPGLPGNFTNEPLFVDHLGGDLHLQLNSPCINAGNNDYAANSVDLDSNPRISRGTVDVGAYEFQNPASTIPYIWLWDYGLPIDSSTDTADPDHDGMNNWQEWMAGTDPTNALSVFKMSSLTAEASGITVSWQSVDGRTYYLQQSTNLSAQPAFVSIQSNIAGLAGTTSYKDVSATNSGAYFYRVGLQ